MMAGWGVPGERSAEMGVGMLCAGAAWSVGRRGSGVEWGGVLDAAAAFFIYKLKDALEGGKLLIGCGCARANKAPRALCLFLWLKRRRLANSMLS